MKYICLIFFVIETCLLSAQKQTIYHKQLTLPDTFTNRKVGPCFLSSHKVGNLPWNDLDYVITSEYVGKDDTIWPIYPSTPRVWKIRNIDLFNQDKLVLMLEHFGSIASVSYLVFGWNNGRWQFLYNDIFAHYELKSPSVEIEIVDFNRIICKNYNKKELIEYDLTTKTEKRTEIKE